MGYTYTSKPKFCEECKRCNCEHCKDDNGDWIYVKKSRWYK